LYMVGDSEDTAKAYWTQPLVFVEVPVKYRGEMFSPALQLMLVYCWTQPASQLDLAQH